MKKNADIHLRRFLADHFKLPVAAVKADARMVDLHRASGNLHTLACLPYELEKYYGIVLTDKNFDRISRGSVHVKKISGLCTQKKGIPCSPKLD